MRYFSSVCRLLSVSQGYSGVGVDRHDDYSADSSPSLAQYGFVGGFLPNFAIFALVSVHLRKFNFSSLPSFGISIFQCFSLPTQPAYSPLSLSSSVAVSKQCQSAYSSCSFLVSVLALGVRAAAHLLWWFSVLFALLCIPSVAGVLYLLFLLLLRVFSALAAPPCCVSSANLGTPAVSTRCLAAGCPSGVPLLAPLFRMAGRPGSAPLLPMSSWL